MTINSTHNLTIKKTISLLTFILLFIIPIQAFCQGVGDNINLIPGKICETPNYWCTWKTQALSLKTTLNAKPSRGEKLDNLNEEHLFGKNGWATIMYPEIRKDLYLLFDDGWEVTLDSSKTGNDRVLMGTMELAMDKFPSCTGTPAQRLKKLNQLCRNFGWKGAALWIPAQASGEKDNNSLLDSANLTNYFKKRILWCKEADIRYLKVDWGTRMGDLQFRAMLTNLAKIKFPELLIEHANGSPPLNDYGCPYCSADPQDYHQTGRYANMEKGRRLKGAVEMLPISQVFRTYDVSKPFSVPTTLDRIAELLKVSSGKSEISSILNCEDNPTIGAALGCALGLMRGPYEMTKKDVCFDEAVRAVNWHKIAPAFGVGYGINHIDTTVFKETTILYHGKTWFDWYDGKEVGQAAPARISRNMPLPEVVSQGPAPFVIASLNPNGAVSVATLGRISTRDSTYFPLANISIDAGNGKNPIGIFGKYKILTLKFTQDISKLRVLGQDLAGKRASDITNDVSIKGNIITLPGELIEKIGLSEASINDASEAGMILILRK